MIKALKLSSSKLISRIKNKWTLRMQSAFLTFTVRAKSEVYIRRKSLRPNLTAAIYTFIQCIKCMIMHLSSWLVEAYMRFLYFSELNHNSEFISAFKGGVSYSFFIIVSPSWFGLTVSVEHLTDVTTQDQPCSACKTVTSHSSGVCRLSVFLISGLRVAAMPANTSTPLAFVLVFCCSSHCHSSSRAALYCQSVSGFVR